MAPPKKYTNITISITGSASAVITPSTLRSDSRRALTIIVESSVSPDPPATRSAASSTAAPRGYVSSVIGALAFGIGAFGVLAFRGRGVSGQGQEDVIEAGGVHGEVRDPPPVGVELVEQGAHRGPLAVAGDLERQQSRVVFDHPRAGRLR